MRLRGPFNTFENVRHGAGAIGSQDFDSVHVGLLGNTELLACNSAGAVSSVAVSIFVCVALGNCLTPVCPTFKVNVFVICTSVNDIGVNTFAAIMGVEVLVEGAEAERIAMGDTG